MSLSDDQKKFLRQAIELTQEEELDCEGFLENLASYADGRIDDAKLQALYEHHRKVCPECDEELRILIKALGREV